VNILSWDLGPGETQVITQAIMNGADRVVIDDLEGRRCAKAMGLAIIGTLGIVGRAKAAGLIERAAPVIQRLQETGLYVSDDIVQRLLREVGE
jgi:predicted nucleic acid-binding protein